MLQPILNPVVHHAERYHRFVEPMRTRNNERLDVGKHIEPFHGAGDSICNNLARQVRDIDAVARVALALKNVGRDSAELWHPVDGNADRAAPGVVDADVGKLRIYLHHSRL